MTNASNPMEALRRLAGTGDPYFSRALEDANPVKIYTIRRSIILRKLIETSMPGFEPVVHQCYDNSLAIARILERKGVEYVEGFVIDEYGINSHAWITFDGRHYDPTYEYTLRDFQLKGGCRNGSCYISILQIGATELYQKVVPGGKRRGSRLPNPVTISLWGFPPSMTDLYGLKPMSIDSAESIFSNQDLLDKIRSRRH